MLLFLITFKACNYFHASMQRSSRSRLLLSEAFISPFLLNFLTFRTETKMLHRTEPSALKRVLRSDVTEKALRKNSVFFFLIFTLFKNSILHFFFYGSCTFRCRLGVCIYKSVRANDFTYFHVTVQEWAMRVGGEAKEQTDGGIQ